MGTQAGKIIRIIRLIRLIRIVKLYKNANNIRGREVEVDDDDIDYEQEAIRKQQMEAEEKEPQESKVGKKLSDLTTRRVIILVLSMMFSVPFLTLTTYKEENNSFIFGLELIDLYAVNSTGFDTMFDAYVEEHKSIRTPLVLLKADGQDWQEEGFEVTDLRSSEYELASPSDATSNIAAVFDLRPNTRFDAGLSIIRTIFICFVLAGGALFFSRDT